MPTEFENKLMITPEVPKTVKLTPFPRAALDKEDLEKKDHMTRTLEAFED
jgi:hypothetical protein